MWSASTQTNNPGSSDVTALRLVAGAFAFHKAVEGVNAAQAAYYGHDQWSVPINESAAWLIAKALGPPWTELVPAVVIRSLWPAAPLKQGFGALSEKAPGDTNREAPLHLPGVCDPAALFDALIAQQDRHMTNYRWDGATLGLLDNAYAFAAPGDSPTTGRPYYAHASVFVAQRQAEGRSALDQTELDALDRLVDNATFLDDLGLILLAEQFDALKARAAKMLQTGRLLDILEF